MRFVLLLMLFLSFSLSVIAQNKNINSTEFSEIARELISVQEDYLSSIVPRPTGKAITNHYPELVRRMELIVDTWPDCRRGHADAKSEIEKGKFVLKGIMPLNQIEQEYVNLLRANYSCEFKQASSPLTNGNDIIYAYGFNSQMAESFRSRFPGVELGQLIAETVLKIYGKEAKYSYMSLFFVPWRFAPPAEYIRVIEPRTTEEVRGVTHPRAGVNR